MSELLKLIDNRIEKHQSQTAIKSLPCKVISVNSDNEVTVELYSNKARYTVPNYSGSAVAVGESVLLYYTGTSILASKSYIGASINKEAMNTLGFVTGSVYTGAIFSQDRVVASVQFEAVSNTIAQITFNYVLLGTSSAETYIEVLVNGTKQSYKPIVSLTSGQYYSASLVIPIEIISGQYNVDVQAHGTNNISSGTIAVTGHNITVGSSYDPTDESDYIFETPSNTSNVIYYVGQTVNPEVPTTLNGKPVTILRATAFSGTSIETVYIPDGVTMIE